MDGWMHTYVQVVYKNTIPSAAADQRSGGKSNSSRAAACASSWLLVFVGDRWCVCVSHLVQFQSQSHTRVWPPNNNHPRLTADSL